MRERMNAYFPLKGEKWFYNLPIKEFSDMLFFYCDKNDNETQGESDISGNT